LPSLSLRARPEKLGDRAAVLEQAADVQARPQPQALPQAVFLLLYRQRDAFFPGKLPALLDKRVKAFGELPFFPGRLRLLLLLADALAGKD